MVKAVFANPLKYDKIKDMMKVDMHSHSVFSDGEGDVLSLVRRAKKLGIGVCITDHNEIKGSLGICKKIKFSIPSIEVTSREAYDLLVYFYSVGELKTFYNKYVKDKGIKSLVFDFKRLKWSTEELLDYIKKYNCVLSLAHPITYRPKNSYLYLQKKPKLIRKVPCVEVINSAMHERDNKKVVSWAKELNKKITGGSDAHMLKYLGYGLTASYADNVNEFLDNIMKRKNIVVGRSLSATSKISSQAIIFGRNLKW